MCKSVEWLEYEFQGRKGGGEEEEEEDIDENEPSTIRSERGKTENIFPNIGSPSPYGPCTPHHPIKTRNINISVTDFISFVFVLHKLNDKSQNRLKQIENFKAVGGGLSSLSRFRPLSSGGYLNYTPFALRKLGKVLISFEAWNKCALGQVVFRDRFFHSRKCLIGVVSYLDLSSSTVLSEPTVYEQFRRHIFFPETGVGLSGHGNKAETCL